MKRIVRHGATSHCPYLLIVLSGCTTMMTAHRLRYLDYSIFEVSRNGTSSVQPGPMPAPRSIDPMPAAQPARPVNSCRVAAKAMDWGMLAAVQMANHVEEH